MGGKALKNCFTRRMTLEEYRTIEREILTQLKSDFPSKRIEPLTSYRSKESFGDLDVLIEVSSDSESFYQYVKNTFKPLEIVTNAGMYSFEYKEFQIDLIPTGTHSFDFSLDFQKFGDLGNLVRRIAHLQGLKLNAYGLKFKYLDNNQQLQGTVLISKNWKIVLETLGYDYERWLAGFDTLTDVFEYVTSSPFFHESLFVEEAHSRDARREVYQQFLVWLSERVQPNSEYFKKDKSQWLIELFIKFPYFEKEYREIELKIVRQKEVKEKFNARLVTEWSGLTNRELGFMMERIRKSFPSPEAMQQWMLDTEISGIESFVKKLVDENAG